jgi:hypothetical protein
MRLKLPRTKKLKYLSPYKELKYLSICLQKIKMLKKSFGIYALKPGLRSMTFWGGSGSGSADPCL